MNQAELYNKFSKGQHNYGLFLIDQINPSKGDKVLDIGSGTGNLTRELADRVGLHGKVIAVDPDTERMAVAQAHYDSTVHNIEWYNGTLTSYPHTKTASNNFAYSNYVFHWIPDQEQSVKAVYDSLLPGGKFAFSVVCGHPEIIEDLMIAMGDEASKKLRNMFHYRSKESWLHLFQKIGFHIIQTEVVADYRFDSLEDLLVWWQATTHGVFDVKMLSPEQMLQLKSKYPGEIGVYSDQTLSLIAQKAK